MSAVILAILLPLSMAAVVGVLLLGLVNMARGGSPERSQKLMQQRVLFQAVAVFLALGLLWALSPG